MTDTNVHDAWNAFWEHQSRGPAAASGQKPGRGTGCLPDGWQGIEDTRGARWKKFAATLPRNAKLLDLASGDGIVMTQVMAARRDIKPVGIDLATALPPAPRGAKLRGGVSMENLPFGDNQFAVVTSQFGFEYGRIDRIAAEIARVLRPAGQLALMTHRIDGPIVAHNRKRREQLRWALEEQQLLGIAKRSLALRGAGIAAIPVQIIEAPEKGAALHGPSSAAWEIAEAIRRTLHLGRQDAAPRVASILDDIANQAENELGRIASLELAAEAASDRETVVAVLAAAGLELEREEPLLDGRAPMPFADFRVYKRTA
ncbi:class I SAM-dependent methyltransferase [Aurantiacibacter marinus]|uniref:Methyltransferase type 11 domain-containing protein n=1 Tax=Aurantiacibacter marinus TaxID=874156 RepID=A0A0H0XTQ1_9SPHN|nr:methyltransferase domain-containing protein [Aurantiacibacter marinus]KLI63690.1 hypothetical protein AAV99_08125 [Aurantiacibacter marinus]